MKGWLHRLMTKRHRLAEKIYNCKFHQEKFLKLYLLLGDIVAGCEIIRWRWEWNGKHES